MEVLLRLPPDELAVLFQPLSSAAHGSTSSPSQPSPAATESSIERHLCSASSTCLSTQTMSSSPTPPSPRWHSTTTDTPPPPPPNRISITNRGPSLDYRHGRVLFDFDDYHRHPLTVWDPITNEQHHIQRPNLNYMSTCYYAAVHCTANGCDHLDCCRCPFLVVFVASCEEEENLSAWVYASESGTWSALSTLQRQPFNISRSGLVSILEMRSTSSLIITTSSYDLTERHLSMHGMPDEYEENTLIVEDGCLRFAGLRDSVLFLWSLQTDLNGTAGWALRKAINLDMLLPIDAISTSFHLNGFVENTCTIFITTNFGVFTIDLNSEQMRKVAEISFRGFIVPYMSFFTPEPYLNSLQQQHPTPEVPRREEDCQRSRIN